MAEPQSSPNAFWMVVGFKFHCSPDTQLHESFLSPLKPGYLLAPEGKGEWEVTLGNPVGMAQAFLV